MSKLQEQFEDETGMVAFGRGIDCKIYSDAYVEWLESKAGQHETIVMLPNDIDEFLTEVTDNDGWVFNRGKWQKYGWRSRTTKEVYQLYQRDKKRFGA